MCAFKQFKKSTFKTISRVSTCESFVFRIAFLYSRCSHTKAWKLHDKNTNEKNNAVHRMNWIESRHIKSISSWNVSERESIEILNHDEQIFNARNVSSSQLNWARFRLFFCVKLNKLKISNLNSSFTRRTSYAEMTQLRRTLFERSFS